MTPILSVKELNKSFGGTPALSDMQLSVYPGEVHALMGENGAGKSTLIKLITGIYQRDAGQVILNGQNINPKSNYEAQNLGISTVYQEVNLVPNLTVAENIFLGREPTKWGKIIPQKIHDDAIRALKRLDLEIDVDRSLEDYPIAIQQMTAIARALDMSAKILILDEATSSLDRKEVDQLFSILRKLREEGLAIIFVTHFLDQVYQISDRITVLRNGRFITEQKINEITKSQLVAKMMGHDLEILNSVEKNKEKRISENPLLASTGSEVAWLKCKNVRFKGSDQNFNLEIKDGETLGLAGLLGSGRTEIARLLFGLDSPIAGEVEIDGEKFNLKNPPQAVRQGFALCPEDRKAQSIFPGLSVRENIILALQGRIGWFKKLSNKKQNEIVDHYVKALGIRARDADQPIETLSGGNQQKAILARWLALDPRLLILDEPTRGIDVGAKAEIQKYILGLSNKKKSILFISSELEEVVRSCDRVVILKDRQKIRELEFNDISEKAIIGAIGEAK